MGRKPLLGVPFSIKDVFLVEDLTVTAGSKILSNLKSAYTSTVVERLLNAGAILICSDNLDAFGHGGSSTNTIYGPVKNVQDTDLIAGGSSGGSAVNVALGMVTFSVGEDTGGASGSLLASTVS